MQRNPHRLSSCGRITAFNCKRVYFATNDGERSELTFSSLSFEREENRFSKASDGAAVISSKRSARVGIVKCKCALDARNRVTKQCVLVTRKSEKGVSFQYSLLTLGSSNRLEPCIQFKLSYQMNEDVCILQGPTVLWTHVGNVFYTSLQAGEVRQIPIQLSRCVIAELPLRTGQIFVLGLQHKSEECPNNQATQQTLGYFVETGHVFDGSMILPHPYICITRCMLVLSADRVDGVLKSAVVVATSNQQMVYFENGIVKDTCQLPFEEPEDIQVVNAGRNACLFVISFHQGHVCAVWKETLQVCEKWVFAIYGHSFIHGLHSFLSFRFHRTTSLNSFLQIACHWSGVSSVHVDDFLRCGTDQMLFVFKEQDGTGPLLDHFLLTDLCGISYSVSCLCSILWKGFTVPYISLNKVQTWQSSSWHFSVARTVEHQRNLIHQKTIFLLFRL